MKHKPDIIWDNINQLKFKLVQAELTKQTIEDSIQHQKSLGMHTSYKTIKFMKRDLHNTNVNIKMMNKLLRKEKLRHEQATR